MQVVRMVRNLKIIAYKHKWGNRVFSPRRNGQRLNRCSDFWKIIIDDLYFIISSSEGSISAHFGS